MTDNEYDDGTEPTLEFFDSAAEPGEAGEPGEPSLSQPATSQLPPSQAQRLLRSRTVVTTALVGLGVAGGVAIGAGLPSRHSSSPASSAAPTVPGQNGGPGNGFGEFPGNGNFPGGGFPGFGDNGLPSTGNGGSSSSTTSDGPSATDAAAIAHDVDPGVADITTTMTDGEAAGTGMVLTSDGIVLTNNHVIDGATSISVRDVGNNQTYKATVLGYDKTSDVAVLQLQNASGLTTVKTATSEPGAGAAVVGIGNAEGTGGTPSYAGGAITGTSKTITAHDQYDGTSEQLTGLLATDADIQSGDSGGPLVNTSGEVVGMNTAATANESFSPFGGDRSGVSRGYAIPIVTALAVAQQIESGHSSSTVHIGPTAQLGVYISGRQQGSNGVTVEQAQGGGPADNAGIAAGDRITSIDGTSVTSPNALTTEMTTLAPGQKVSVAYETTDGTSHTVTVTLTEGPPQ